MKALIKNSNGVFLQQKENSAQGGVLLKVHTVGLCRTDLLVASNKIKIEMEEIILGHEFSAQVENDPSGTFTKGQWVGVNPLWNGKFMGRDFNGAICEYINVPKDKVIPTISTDPKLIAYLEPVAASMAVLKVLHSRDSKIAIVGHNRIAYLTLVILKSYGFDVDYLNEKENIKENFYDFIIETVFEEEVLKKIVTGLKEGGTLIIKSRKSFPVSIISSDLVAKEINFRAVNYYNFDEAMRWLEINSDLVQELLGNVYPVEQWQEAFSEAQSGEQKKIFIKV